MLKAIRSIFFEMIPVLVMIGLIPIIKSDYLLSLFYILIISLAFYTKYVKNEYTIFLCGVISMVLFEFIFISAGVETFIRNSLLGVMPLWLPLLWGYGFVAINRASRHLTKG